MMTDDKYGICNAIDWHFRNQGILEVSDRIFAIKCVASIWEEVYIKMPLSISRLVPLSMKRFFYIIKL